MKTQLIVSLFLLILAAQVRAESHIAVPDFELLNLSMPLSDPKKVAEINDTDQKNLRTIETILRNGIKKIEGFNYIPIPTKARNDADKSTGYLFDCGKCAAALGREHGADYIVIGRHHKPTYLFSYIIARVFNTTDGSLVKEFRSEVKGNPKTALPGGAYLLLSKIDKTLPH